MISENRGVVHVWPVLFGIACGLLLIWVGLIVALWVTKPDEVTMRDSLRLLPDVLRLAKRLSADRTLPAGVRVRVGLLLVYLALPIDLIPDFIPVVGYADDAIVIALVLRSVARRAGDDALTRHWPGTPDGLTVVRRLCGLGSADQHGHEKDRKPFE